MKPVILDDFLDPKSFQVLKNTMLGGSFNWVYNDAIDYADDEDKFQFTHSFYKENLGPTSTHYGVLSPILNRIRIKEIFRIKANLLTRTPKIELNSFHTDVGGNMGVIPYTTTILYMNTNNGYTEFEDGTKVESVANRIVSFPEETKHRGTSCTDEKIRMVINFNFLT